MWNGGKRAVRRLELGATTMAFSTKARFLMCAPDHFGVAYKINPWMDPEGWVRCAPVLAAASRREWSALHVTLSELGCAINLVAPAPGVPDLVFTANAAVVLDRVALLARFRHPERQREEEHFEAAFRALQGRGLVDAVRMLPTDVILEGAGDCVWDSTRNLFWIGFGPRSDAASRHVVEEVFGVPAITLELADPRFYHMDTALCPLPHGEVMYVPEAFTRHGLAFIRDLVDTRLRIEIDAEDASRLAANAVCVENTIVMSGCSEHLRCGLTERGYHVVTTPLESFLRSGGSAFCLTLRLDRSSSRGALDQSAVA
jgi:N-dimethylarginine dimethylaminohydrolase